MLRRFAFCLWCGLAACSSSSPKPTPPTGDPQPQGDDSTAGFGGSAGAAATGPIAKTQEAAELLYPTPRALFDNAIQPSCAQNQGRCHFDWAAPALDGASHLFDVAPCQTTVAVPSVIFDECEQPGDALVASDGSMQAIVSIEVAANAPSPPSFLTVHLAGPADSSAAIVVARLDFAGKKVLSTQAYPDIDVDDGPDAQSLVLHLGGLAASEASRWDVRNYPRADSDIRVGDPNGNGIVGATQSGRAEEISPGAPNASFLYQRLRDSTHGPQMPSVVGAWDATATRAVWCFISAEPSDLDHPIDYADCAADPNAPTEAITGFPAVALLFENSCALSQCHDAASKQEGLDLTATKANIAASVIGVSSQEVAQKLIDPGHPETSYLLCKLDPTCAAQRGAPMPKDLPAIDAATLATVTDFIAKGAVVPP